MTRSKDIGTRAEAAVVRYLCANGWSTLNGEHSEARPTGATSPGTPGLVWEVKGGDAAKDASDNQIAD